MKVAKFGGTSLADASQIKKTIKIIKSDPERRCIIVSAPGKRNPEDAKITDLLYEFARSSGQRAGRAYEKMIIYRYQKIINDFWLKINFESWFKGIKDTLKKIRGRYREDYIASRGEYFMAVIMAEILGYKFVDAKLFIVFNNSGLLDVPQTEKLAKKIGLKATAIKRGIVVPGFYGTMSNGKIKTFSRGGSDITGAIVASCIGASIYENWTDVSGVFMADPRIIENPRKIEKLTYCELRELAYMGANVLHDESVFPVRKLGIPINVKNTNSPEDNGTMIVQKIGRQERIQGSIIGIAGKKGFSIIKIEKTLMDCEIGFLRRVCQTMEEYNINIEHIPSGIDTLSVVVESLKFDAVSKPVLEKLTEKCNPDTISVQSEIALICVVGSAMVKTPGVVARIFRAVAAAGINVIMINQCSSEISVIIGVENKDYKATICAIYNEFTD